jgi:hypothetical protein
MGGVLAESAFGVVYDGPAVDTGQMAVRDLAPALLALGDLFAEASVLVHPQGKPVGLSIKATTEGSFVIHLVLEAEHAWDHFVDLFSSNSVTALVNLTEVVIGSMGLFQLIRMLRGRQIKEQLEAPTAGHIELTLDDGETLEIPARVLDLYKSLDARKNAQQVVAPLAGHGIDRIEFTNRDEVTVSMDKADAPAFQVHDVESIPLSEEQLQMFVSISSVAFTDGNKWRLNDGERTFFAAIEDEDFLKRVNDGSEFFRKGDMLRAHIRLVQSQGEDGLHTEYAVTEVIEHIPRMVQLRIEGGEPQGGV